MAGTMGDGSRSGGTHNVSMESGLDGRNNGINAKVQDAKMLVSMESGLDGRNNPRPMRVLVEQCPSSQWSPA